MKPSRLCFAGLLGCVAALVGCDHATKVVAESALRDRAPLALVDGVLDLSYTENHDVAFDAMSRMSLHPASWVLVSVAVATIVAILGVWARRRRASWPEHLGFACIVAGAIGNVLDRATRGHVVDFIHLQHWPVFNVADVLVVAGMGLLVAVGWSRRRAPPTGEI
jgi:signal peptidase II